MGNHIFSCCLPGNGQRHSSSSGGKLDYARLQDSGNLGGARVANELCLDDDAMCSNKVKHVQAVVVGGSSDRRIGSTAAAVKTGTRESVERSSSGSGQRQQEQPAHSTTIQGGSDNNSNDIDTSRTRSNTSRPKAAVGGSTGGNNNGNTTVSFSSSSTHARPRGNANTNGVAFAQQQTPSDTSSAAGAATRPARIVHAHPNNDSRQGIMSGAGAGSGRGNRGRGGASTRGRGRFGVVAFGAAGAAGAGVRGLSAARGMPRPVPAASEGILAKYEMKEVLGVGSTSTCYRCINRSTRKQYACKVGGGGWRVWCVDVVCRVGRI